MTAADPFSITVRVYYEDTDAGGIVYYANYLKFCERARTDFLRDAGFSQQGVLQNGFGFVISTVKARYLAPARLDDLLTVSCCPLKVRQASLTFYQQVFRDQTMLFEMECAVAFISHHSGRPQVIPPAVREALMQRAQEGNTLTGVKL